jgi:dihydrodipicolinate synthase/N-acetylneuraminate lyase
MKTSAEWARRPAVMIAGIVGRTAQATQEAQLAVELGYHAGLLSLAAMKGSSEDEMIAHANAVAREIPLVGFYLQPAVGGIVLPTSFWRRFAAIENVVAIKIAPFNRYRTLDVVRGVVEAGAVDRVTLYTGNDDHIVPDCSAIGASGFARLSSCSTRRIWPQEPTLCRPISWRSTRK